MGLFGQALLDYYHHSDPVAFFICDEQKDRELDLRFYLTPRPDHLEATLLERAMGRCRYRLRRGTHPALSGYQRAGRDRH